jgi:hypothetical protein
MGPWEPSTASACAAEEDGEVGRIVHVFSVHPFKGDVVVLGGERSEVCSVDEVDT